MLYTILIYFLDYTLYLFRNIFINIMISFLFNVHHTNIKHQHTNVLANDISLMVGHLLISLSSDINENNYVKILLQK